MPIVFYVAPVSDQPFGGWADLVFLVWRWSAAKSLLEATPTAALVSFPNKESPMINRNAFYRSKVQKHCRWFKHQYFRDHAIDPHGQWIYSRPDGRYIHFKEATIDHVIPFSKLLRDFINQYGEEDIVGFRRYHRERAVLRVISASLNHQLGLRTESM